MTSYYINEEVEVDELLIDASIQETVYVITVEEVFVEVSSIEVEGS